MLEMVARLCVAECESVVHVLWECSSYSTCRDNFQEALKQFLIDAIYIASYAEFERLSIVEKHHMCSVAKIGRTISMLCCIE